MTLSYEINKFREAARHLWNVFFREQADHDLLDGYIEICRLLYKELVCSNCDKLPVIPIDHGKAPLPEYKLFADHSGKLPLMVNRDITPSGYWDYPIDWIPPEEPSDIQPISFFDFDVLGWRNLEYYRSKIIMCSSHPEIEGREALIRCDYIDIAIRDA